MPDNQEMAAALSGIDPWTAAAIRQRQGVMPEGGRQEGVATKLLENYVPHALQGLASLPQRATQAAGELQQTGDTYNPQPAMETAQMMMGRTPFSGAGEAGVFGGRLAQTADLSKLKKAEEMAAESQQKIEKAHRWYDSEPKAKDLAEGRSKSEIFNETGWFQGTDGKWRFEIPDQHAYGATIPRNLISEDGTVPLKYYLQHDPLFEAYPALKDTKISGRLHPGSKGTAWLEKDEIGIDPNLPRIDRASIALHEIQHKIQNAEDFAPGTNPDYVRHLASSRLPWSILGAPGLDAKRLANEGYSRFAGEVEARNVQDRYRFMHNPGDLLKAPPFRTMDRPAHTQIFDADWFKRQTPQIQDYVKALIAKKHNPYPPPDPNSPRGWGTTD